MSHILLTGILISKLGGVEQGLRPRNGGREKPKRIRSSELADKLGYVRAGLKKKNRK